MTSTVFDQARAEAAVRELLFAVGEDPDGAGLIDTPARVARAYKELEAHGTIRTRGRAGTFVAASADARADAAHQAVRRCLDTLLERLGYTPDEAVELVRRDAAARA